MEWFEKMKVLTDALESIAGGRDLDRMVELTTKTAAAVRAALEAAGIPAHTVEGYLWKKAGYAASTLQAGRIVRVADIGRAALQLVS